MGMKALNEMNKNDAGNQDSSRIRPQSINKDEVKKTSNNVVSVININKKKSKLDSKYQWIHGNLLSFIKKLTVQLWTNLKALASKSEQYEKRKKNTDLLLNTYKKAVFYFGKLGDKAIQSEIEVLSMSVIHSDYDEKMDILNIDKKEEKKEQKTNKNKTKKIM